MTKPGRPRRRTAADYEGDAFARRTVEGVLSVSRGGTGFVSPRGGGEDIVVPEERVGPALPGDVVEVALERPGSGRGAGAGKGAGGDARLCGRIVRVLERGARDIVCILRRTGRSWTAVPLIPFGGRTFHVSDVGAARDGDRVVVRFSSWSNPAFNPEAELVAVIGPDSEPSLDTESVIRSFELPAVFPPEVVEEARRAPAMLAAPGEREDMRGLTVVTIDPPSARDFDDALSMSRDAEGRRVLGVHIADVSHFVRPGSALDAEARRRGTSAYLVDTVLPMLPEQLSNGVCSLVPGEDRLVFSAFLTFDEAGIPVARRFAKGVIRSARRLTYAEALDAIRRRGEGAADTAENVLVRELSDLSQRLRRNRFAHFSLDISSSEPEIVLGPDGRIVDVRVPESDEAHQLVEEAMIAANEAVAAELAKRRIPHLCRFHDVPDPEKLDALQESLRALGLRVPRLVDSGAIVRLLKSAKGTPLETFVSMSVLRSMKRAEYSADKEGHFGLAKRHYSHFTSPIRRYPDLVLHRQLAAALAGDRAAQPKPDELRAIASESTKTEFRADQAERSLVEIKKYRFLEEKLAAGEEPQYDAVVSKCRPFGAFADIPDLAIEGMVHVSTLSDAFVRFDPQSGRLSAPGIDIGPGSVLRVAVTGVDFDERKIALRAVSVIPDGQGAPDGRESRHERASRGETPAKPRGKAPAKPRGKTPPKPRGKGPEKGRKKGRVRRA